MGSMYKTTMSANSSNQHTGAEFIEQMHTREEIIHHAQEVLAQQMGMDLHTFAGLEEVLEHGDDGDWIRYVDKSGNAVQFTEERQFKAAIAVLNSNGHFFQATPVEESRSGLA